MKRQRKIVMKPVLVASSKKDKFTKLRIEASERRAMEKFEKAHIRMLKSRKERGLNDGK